MQSPTCIQDQNSVAVHDSWYTMCNADDGTFREFLSDDPLDGCICLRINRSRCLIHEEDPAAFQYDTTEAEELLLPYTPVLPHVGNCDEQAVTNKTLIVCCQY